MAKGLFDLTGKVAMITGGSTGIGLGFARGVARQGGTVVLWARNADKLAAAKDELAAFGGTVTTQVVDISSRDAIKDGYAALLAEHGRVDAVFANAGRPSNSRSLLTLEADEWHDLLDTSLHGAFFTLQEAARHMVARAEAGDPGGSLVFCGSLSMFLGIGGIHNYTASKGGMGAVIRGLAAELGQYRIRANTIAPGLIRTEMHHGLADDHPMFDKFRSVTPIPRIGDPADFEGIGAYLVSDASSFHTGDTIIIDGGSVIRPAFR